LGGTGQQQQAKKGGQGRAHGEPRILEMAVDSAAPAPPAHARCRSGVTGAANMALDRAITGRREGTRARQAMQPAGNAPRCAGDDEAIAGEGSRKASPVRLQIKTRNADSSVTPNRWAGTPRRGPGYLADTGCRLGSAACVGQLPAERVGSRSSAIARLSW
jgi:hypothetical protein